MTLNTIDEFADIEEREDSDSTVIDRKYSATMARTVSRFDLKEPTEVPCKDVKVASEKPINTSAISSGVGRVSDDKSPVAAGIVLEQFLGQLNEVDGEVAHITLTAADGEKIYGDCDAALFREEMVQVGGWFDCTTVKRGEQVTVEIKRRQRVSLTREMHERIDAELEADLEGL